MGAGRGHAPGGKGTDGPRKAILLATLVLVSSLYSLFLILLFWGIRRSSFGMCKPHLNEWEDVVATKRERGRVCVRCSLFIPFSAGWLLFWLFWFRPGSFLANRPSQTIESLDAHPEILWNSLVYMYIYLGGISFVLVDPIFGSLPFSLVFVHV